MSQKYPTYKGLNLPEVTSRVGEQWENNSIFQKSVDTREGKEPFIFFEGPPSANGLPGIHHVMGRTIKDIFCRYKTLKGYQVKRKAGWDTHGLPVELGVEKELGIRKWQVTKYNDLPKSHELTEGERIFIKPKRCKSKEDFHIVRKGESLRDISQLYGVKLKKLYKRNRLDEGAIPKAGQKINLRKKIK